MIDEHERWGPDTRRIHGFSEEASAAVSKEIANYSAALIVAARRQTQAELVLESDVQRAIQAMRSPKDGTARRAQGDWFTQIGFLFAGLALAQLDAISQAGTAVPVERVYWLAGYTLAAAVMALVGTASTRSGGSPR